MKEAGTTSRAIPGMRMCNHVEDLISVVENYIEKHRLLPVRLLVVGVSGGADSMALLFVLQDICKRKYPDIPILCAHVNHGIRKEADQDEKLVSDFCDKLNIPFLPKHVDIPEMAEKKGLSLETAGRIARYDFFQSVSGEDGAVAVAHHMEDQAESVAMHIFRGSGMEGLCGIRPENGNIIHPFLCLHKVEILSFCEEKKIPYCHDMTNDDPSYDRNFWRHEVFPMIEKGTSRDPISALVGLAGRISEENDYLDQIASEALDPFLKEGKKTVPADALAKMPRALKRRVMRLLALRTYGDVVDLEACHWEAVAGLSEKTGGVAYIDLPNGRVAARERGEIFFTTRDSASAVDKGGYIEGAGIVIPEKDAMTEVALKDLPVGEMVNFSQRFGQMRLRFIEKEAEVVYNNLTWFFPYSELEGAVIRTRRNGDTMCRAGSDTRKSLRRFMNEAQIPPRFRDRLLLVARGSETLWLPTFAHAVGFTDCESEQKFRKQRAENRGPEGDSGKNGERLMALEFFDRTT